MPLSFFSLLGNWKIVLPILLTLLAGGFFFYHRATVTSLRQERDDLRLAVVSYQKNIETLRRLSEAEKEALRKNLLSERKSHEYQTQLREAATTASPNDDAPVAPVLSVAIDSLRETSAPD